MILYKVKSTLIHINIATTTKKVHQATQFSYSSYENNKRFCSGQFNVFFKPKPLLS